MKNKIVVEKNKQEITLSSSKKYKLLNVGGLEKYIFLLD